MDNRPLVSIPPSQYNDFLFAVACENSNGTQLSVLSALARTNVDPWEEAARLSAMAERDAEKALVLLLNRTSGHNWVPSEEDAIATRLVRLLPRWSDGVGSASAITSNGGTEMPKLWLVWLSFAIAISVFSPRHQQTAATGASVTEPKTDAASQNTNGNAESRLGSAKDRSPGNSETRTTTRGSRRAITF